MPTFRVTTVCLPEATPLDDLVTTAAAHLPGIPTPTPVPHFATRRRWPTRTLLLAVKNAAAGGPIRHLDLDCMTGTGRRIAHDRFAVWHRVVADTKPAQPFWTFIERHRNDPQKYSLTQAKTHYLAQPRIAAMRIYNLLPNRYLELPTADLEALQAGGDAYTHLGGLTAVPATKLVTLTGRHLTSNSERLSDLLTYLDEAHRYLRTLHPTHQLVALTDN